MYLIAAGQDINELPQYESTLEELDKGEVRFYLDHPVSEDVLRSIEEDITSQGVILTGPILQDAGMIIVPFQKALAPLLIIAGAVAAGIVVFAGVLGWQLFSWMSQVPWWAWFLVGFGTLFVLVGGSDKMGRAVGAARR